MKNWIQIIVVGFLVLAQLGMSYAQDPTRIRGSVDIKMVGVEEPVTFTFDLRTPWRSNTIVNVVSDGLPATAAESAKYDRVILPTSESHGSLEYGRYPKELKKPAQVAIEYPLEVLEKNNMTYAQRYVLLELSIQQTIQAIIEQAPGEVRIAIASFFHPIYYSNANLVAFHTLMAIEKAIGKSKKTFHFTILANGNSEIQKTFDAEYKYRLQIAKDIDTNKPLSKRQGLATAAIIEQSPDKTAEMFYYLERWESLIKTKTLKNGKMPMTMQQLMQLLADPKQVENQKILAPDHVIETFQKMLLTAYPGGTSPDMTAIRGKVRAIVEKRYGNSLSLTATIEKETNEIMEKIESKNISALMKTPILAEIAKGNSQFKVEETIRRVIKK